MRPADFEIEVSLAWLYAHSIKTPGASERMAEIANRF